MSDSKVGSIAAAAYGRRGSAPPPDLSEETLAEGAWLADLRHTQGGKVASCIDNLHQILARDSRWQEVLTWCEFSYRVETSKAPPWEHGREGEWRDIDTSRLRIWLGQHYGLGYSTNDVDEAVLVVAHGRPSHPVRDYLEGLTWDGEQRLQHWLRDYLGAPGTEYVQVVGQIFLIAAVARIFDPGCKADGVLILEGPQGIGKSSAVRTLAHPWFTDSHFALGEKDGYHVMQGVWVCELSELDSFNKAESTRAKSFFAARSDRFRPVYGRRAEDCPRQAVFVGTTNVGSYLRDSTGNRRYWPVSCTEVDVEALEGVRDQLWAEAVQAYRDEVPWWPADEHAHLFQREQDHRFAIDAWEEIIADWVQDPQRRMREWFTGPELLEGALKLEAHQMKPPEQMRLGNCMTRLRWERTRRRIEAGEGAGKRRGYVYVRPDPGAEEGDDA